MGIALALAEQAALAGDVPVGAILILLLSQVAVYSPARRAASVPPAVATRSA